MTVRSLTAATFSARSPKIPRMGDMLVVVVAVVVLFGVVAFLVMRPDREAAARKNEEEALWKHVEADLAMPCPALSEGVTCAGKAVPVRGTIDHYRCPVCGGEF